MALKYTLPQVRDRELAHVKTIGRPNGWWPGGPGTNDCVGFQTVQLGLRRGDESLAWLNAHRHMISIAAFRAHYQWPEVAPEHIRPGDLVLSNWSGDRSGGILEAEHMEWAYSTDGDGITIIGANTGPAPGVASPNGVWRKERPLDGHIIRGIRPTYADEKPSRARRHVVAVVAAYVNDRDHVPGNLPLTTAAAGVGKDSDTGLEGRNYWRRVQTWGRLRGYYGSHFKIDGIPGPQSRIVEAAAYKAATTKK